MITYAKSLQQITAVLGIDSNRTSQNFNTCIIAFVLSIAGYAATLIFGSSAFAADRYVGEYSYRNVQNLGFPSAAAAFADFATSSVDGVGWCALVATAEDDWIEEKHPLYWVDGLSTMATKRYTYKQTSCSGGILNLSIDITRIRKICFLAQRYMDSKCWDGTLTTFTDSSGANNGPSCPFCGRPVNPMNGNMWHVFDDYAPPKALSGLVIRRTYNSVYSLLEGQNGRGFGTHWSHPFEAKLRQEVATFPAYKKPCWKRSDGLVICDTPPITTVPIPLAVSVSRGDGRSYLFNRIGTSYVSDANVNDRVTPIYNADNSGVIGWVYHDANNDNTENFDKEGRLLSIVERLGTALRLTYSDGLTNDTSVSRYPLTAPSCASPHSGALLPIGRLLCVTDVWGRQLQFNYDLKGRIVQAIDPAGQSYSYEYDGSSGGCVPGNEATLACKANNLTKVTFPDGQHQTFYYNELGRINGGVKCNLYSFQNPVGIGLGPFPSYMTGIMDENGGRYLSWNYDCSERATLSEVADGLEKVALSYSTTTNGSGVPVRTTTMTNTVGTSAAPQTTPRALTSPFILGVGKNENIDQPCAECGSTKSRTHDANGNVATSTNFNGAVTKFGYDSARNLETSRIEGFGTPLARTTSTVWHATFRLPVQIAEPLRLTINDFDASGNLLTKVLQATTDASGSAGFSAVKTGPTRTWRYTYNSFGQVTSVTGPRVEFADVMTYSYDSQGNLASVTNAAGHQTLLSNYDAHGQPGQITDPNGVITTFSFSPRGWLTSRSVAGEVSTYGYDGVGQLISATQPDGVTLTYTYDAGHRLTGIHDNAGNSIAYVLDLRGNRISEQVLDSNGALSRQVTRVYDTINRVQKVTGAQQ
jgi:YD repeat-containing protein